LPGDWAGSEEIDDAVGERSRDDSDSHY
jgi:hypothetical protein